MEPPKFHPFEQSRIETLLDYEILDTDAEQVFDDLTELAAELLKTPIALMSFIDEKRQWFKSRFGLDITQTPRQFAFCAHTILEEEVFVIENATQDKRFVDNPLVIYSPNIEFYAGVIIKSKSKLPLGTLCILDTKPRKWTEEQARLLAMLARQAESQLELRRLNLKLKLLAESRNDAMSIVNRELKNPEIVNKGGRLTSQDNMHLFGLLDEIMTWTQTSIGNNKTTLTYFDLAREVNACIELFIDVAQVKNVRIESQLRTPVEVFADEDITRTILRSFISNAIKNSPAHKSVTVSYKKTDDELILYVTDDGANVPSDVRSRGLSALMSSISAQGSELGQGFGLSLCRSMALVQRSRIWVDENPPLYTLCFSMLLTG